MLRALKHGLARIFLLFTRWRFEGEIPSFPRYVLIAAPHTTNWDLVHMLALGWLKDIRVHWMGKHTLFKPPWGWFMRWLGGLPIDRRAPGNMVEQAADKLRAADRMVLVVPPEGTRSKRPYWKSGFYFIAKLAAVPVVMGFLDYSRRVGGLGPRMEPTDDVVADMDVVRGFYHAGMARHPDKFTVPRLRAEEPVVEETGGA